MGKVYLGQHSKEPERKKVYSVDQIKGWINNQRESGKKRTVDGKPFQFDNLDLIEDDYKKRKANGGHTTIEWMHHDKHLFGGFPGDFQSRQDPDDRSQDGYIFREEYQEVRDAIFKGYSWF